MKKHKKKKFPRTDVVERQLSEFEAAQIRGGLSLPDLGGTPVLEINAMYGVISKWNLPF